MILKECRILAVGGFSNYGESNTCLHRLWALKKYGTVDIVDTSLNSQGYFYRVCNKLFNLGFSINLPDTCGANQKIKDCVKNIEYDVVWIDKGLSINARTLKFIKRILPSCLIVTFSPDNMTKRFNQSENYLKAIQFYDYTITTKSYIFESLEEMGHRNIIFAHKTYEPTFHFPMELTETEKSKYICDVGFIGAWEYERCESIKFLADNNIQVIVYGDGRWKDYSNYSKNLKVRDGLFSSDYCKALGAFKISLCFLRKMNQDQQTARTMEIPACGTFMLAERTEEHLELFREGEEAEFFESNEELLEKCRYYLEHHVKREEIAANGLARCQTSGYSNEMLVKKLLDRILSK